MARKKNYSYNVDDPFDRDMVMDLPYSQLNARGRKAKKRSLPFAKNGMDIIFD
jgi:hypothetical protein